MTSGSVDPSKWMVNDGWGEWSLLTGSLLDETDDGFIVLDVLDSYRLRLPREMCVMLNIAEDEHKN